MRAARPDETWEIGHIGGHRFAATFLAFPHGLCFGRVPAARGPEIVAALEAGEIVLEHFRGRAGDPPVVQAADVLVRRRLGLRGLDDVAVEGVDGDTVTLRTPAGVAAGRRHAPRGRAAPDLVRRRAGAGAGLRARGLMRAALLRQPGEPLEPAEVPEPEARDGQLLLRVHACGVCRTDLHLRDGELEPGHLPLILGHQIVGVDEDGRRVGVPWLAWTCGECEYCGAAARTSAAGRASRAATSTAATPSTRSPTSATASRCRTG